MSDTMAIPVKRTARTRKTAVSIESPSPTLPLISQQLKTQEGAFEGFINAITKAKDDFVALQKEIAETKEAWLKEREQHLQFLKERDMQEDLERRREREAYEYEVSKKRREEEDEFSQKKLHWERDLEQRKEELAKEKKELEELKKLAAGFENEKEKAVKEVTVLLQKQLQDTFVTEKKLREQEIKAEKELLVLRISNLAQENQRQTKEIDALKNALEEASTQLKDIAVKVIESSSPKSPPPPKPPHEV